MLQNQSMALLMLGSPTGMRMTLNSTQMSGKIRKKFQKTNFTMPNTSSSMKYALKSVPGLANVGVPHGDGDGLRAHPGVRIKILCIPR